MQGRGDAPVWEAHLGVRGARDDKGWYQQLSHWWTTRTDADREANLGTLSACWDAKREVVTSFRADAALEMLAAQRPSSMATLLYSLAL
jgi:hypothetical protein